MAAEQLFQLESSHHEQQSTIRNRRQSIVDVAFMLLLRF